MHSSDLVLSWPAPAATWAEAAPVGNGRIGAMVFGGTGRARIQINDSTVWSGTPTGPATALAALRAQGAGPERLEEVRAALRAGDQDRAESLLMTFEGPYTQEYLPYADLYLTVAGGERAEYRGRTLDLDTAVAEDGFDLDGTSVRRRVWADAVSGALCVTLDADGGTVDLAVELSTPLREILRSAAPDGITLGIAIPVDGAPDHEPGVAEPLRYADGPVDGYDPFGALALAVHTDGTPTVDDEGGLRVTGASRVLLTLASSTAADRDWSGAPALDRAAHLAEAGELAARALAQGADRLLKDHEADVRALSGGTSLRVGPRRSGTYDVARDILGGDDELLTATVLFQLGRHLLATASRPHTGPPANLQGIWNADPRPAWSSNYTININTQMNYWGAEAVGLSACHEPLFDLLDRLAVQGAHVARELYGARGWVAHHNTDPWGWALPVGMGHGNTSWALWMMGGAWLSQHLWDHYDFTRDLGFLRERAWPLLSGCAEFLLDWLVDDGTGHLDTLPSTSPENLFLADGVPRSLTRSAAMDLALIRATFQRTLAAAELLGLDTPLTGEIRAALPRLRPLPLSPEGRLQEWAEDLTEADPHHRHLSHLIAVHPLGLIDPDSAPELAAAARKSMDLRGPGAMGWSWSWKIVLRAWLRDAPTARSLFLEAIRPLDGDAGVDAPVDGSRWGGLLPNLFSTHPPFQIDGNYGLMAAVAEMVVQSHTGVLDLLPALPAEWTEGEARDLRCRGGLAVDFAWNEGELTGATVRRLTGDSAETVRIRCLGRTAELLLPAGHQVELDALLRPRGGAGAVLSEQDVPELFAYRSAYREPADFDTFWKGTLAETRAGQEAELRLTEVATGLETVDVFDAVLPGFGGHPVHAWLRMPRHRGGPLPAVVQFHGYGSGRGAPIDDLLWPSAGYAHLLVDARGQGGAWAGGGATPDPVGSGPAHPGFLTRGIEDKDTYVYRRVFTDAVRAVDALRARTDLVDPDRVALVGPSQGGGIALAVAGLVPGLAAAHFQSPFLCDIRQATRLTSAEPYAEIIGYLAARRDRVEQTFDTLGYFDGLAFARRATAPARFSAGLRDEVCPPVTAIAAYHAYAGPKELRLWEFNGHDAGGSEDLAVALGAFGALLKTSSHPAVLPSPAPTASSRKKEQ